MPAISQKQHWLAGAAMRPGYRASIVLAFAVWFALGFAGLIEPNTAEAQSLRDDPFALSPFAAPDSAAANPDAGLGGDATDSDDGASSLLRRLGERRASDADQDTSSLRPRARAFLQDGDIADPQLAIGPSDGSYTAAAPASQSDGDLSSDGRFGAGSADADGEGSQAQQFAGDGSVVAADGSIDRLPPDPLAFDAGLVDGLAQPANSPRPDGSSADNDPYAALGVTVGSFLLFPEITAGTTYSDNVFNSATDLKSDFAFEVTPSLRLRSNWNNHEIEANVSALRSFYKRFDSEDARELNAGLRGRLDVTRRTNIEAETSYALSQQSRGSVDLADGAAERPDVETLAGALSFNQRFNRLSFRLRGGMTEVSNGDTVLVDGVRTSGRDEDYLERALALRTSYEFSPALTVFAENEINDRNYGAANEADGIKRDAEGIELRAGVVTEIGPTIRGEISLGYGRREAEDARLQAISGWLVDANLAWRPTALTTLTLTAASDLNDTTLANSLGSVSRSFGLELRHEFLRQLIATAGLNWSNQDYQHVALIENTLVGSIGMEYLLSREASLTARYQHTRFESNEAGRDYEVNAIFAGLRLKR